MDYIPFRVGLWIGVACLGFILVGGVWLGFLLR
jgi:hypothetical protein